MDILKYLIAFVAFSKFGGLVPDCPSSDVLRQMAA